MKYKILAIDVDGTLLRADQTVCPRVQKQIARASAAGLRIVLATGRSYTETMPAWRQLSLCGTVEPMVLIGGALVSEPATGRTLYQRLIQPEPAAAYAEALSRAGYSALAIVDRWRHGLDYVMVESSDADRVRRDWFSQMDVTVRQAASLNGDSQTPPVLRINSLVAPEAAEKLVASLQRQFRSRLNIHSILAPNYGLTVVEAFAPGADKWTALQYVAQAYHIGPGQVAAIGDDVNDLTMIARAGLGAAMPQAPQCVRDAADVTAAGGLAGFVSDLADGRFD